MSTIKRYTNPRSLYFVFLYFARKKICAMCKLIRESNRYNQLADRSVCLEVKMEYYQNHSVLDFVTMFTVISTLIRAVLTGPTDWICHIGILTPCVEAVA